MLNKSGVLNRFSIVLASALALAVTALASSAMASGPFKWHPAPNTFKLSGILTLSQSITIRCNVQIEVSVDANGVATVISRTFSDDTPGVTSPLCGGVVQPFGTWTLTPDSTIQVTAMVGFSSILGSCSGPIPGNWNNVSDNLTFSAANSVPGTPGPCFINGTLTADNDVEIIF